MQINTGRGVDGRGAEHTDGRVGEERRQGDGRISIRLGVRTVCVIFPGQVDGHSRIHINRPAGGGKHRSREQITGNAEHDRRLRQPHDDRAANRTQRERAGHHIDNGIRSHHDVACGRCHRPENAYLGNRRCQNKAVNQPGRNQPVAFRFGVEGDRSTRNRSARRDADVLGIDNNVTSRDQASFEDNGIQSVVTA